MAEGDCPICGEKLIGCATSEIDDNAVFYNCKYCKKYHLDTSFSKDILSNKISIKDKTKLTHMLYVAPNDNYCRKVAISKNNIQELLATERMPSLTNRMKNVLEYFVCRTDFFGHMLIYSIKELYRELYCVHGNELINILNSLNLFLNCTFENHDNEAIVKVLVLPAGMQYYEDNIKTRNDSTQAFVAMWFDPTTEQLYKKIYNAITGNPNANKNSAEYGAHYNIMRIDKKEHINYIPSEIISEIKRSKFMVADLSGYRGGVYYEIGYAEGLGIPVILTCNNKWFDDHKDENDVLYSGVHFDLKQKNILQWEDAKLDEFQRNLVARIGEVVGFNEIY